MLYLASPYSDPDPFIMELRFDLVCRAAGKLMNQGLVVYSPIAHCHPIAVRVGLPRDWEFWQRFDTEMLKAATSFYILTIPGWNDSKGVLAEREIAESMGLPVTYMEPVYLES